MPLPLPRSLRTVFLAVVAAVAATTALANTALEPVPRDANWLKRHEEFVALAKAGNIDVLFLGDSITDFWRNRGKAVWDANFGSLHAANFGISADRTQHVLWRMAHGELDGIQPKVVVLLIGTNNTGIERDTKAPRNTSAEAVQGVALIVHTLLTKLPTTKILLLGLFPRADAAGTPAQIGEVNAALAKMDDGKIVRYLDIGPKFLTPDGTLTKEIMPDLLHPSPAGYEIWAAAIKEPLAEMLRAPAK
jgi:lysophospholipase L1-like esterase